MVYFRVLLIAFLCSLTVGHADARQYRISTSTMTRGSVGPDVDLRGLNFTYEANLTLATLLNEPIIGLKMRWKIAPEDSRVSVPTGEKGFLGRRHADIALDRLGPDALTKIALIELKLRFTFYSPQLNRYFFLIEDVGILRRGDGSGWSYNTPGSMDWNDIFVTRPHAKVNQISSHNYAEADLAKRLFKEKLELQESMIIAGKVTLFDLQNWYWRESGLGEAEALEAGIRKMSTNLHRTYGFSAASREATDRKIEAIKVSSGLRGFTGAVAIKDARQYTDRLKHAFDTLQNLPEAYVRSNPDAYNRIVAAAQATYSAARSGFASSDADPSEHPEGQPLGKVDGGAEMVPYHVAGESEDGGWGYKDAHDTITVAARKEWSRTLWSSGGIGLVIERDLGLQFIDDDGRLLRSGLFDQRFRDATGFFSGYAAVELESDSNDHWRVIDVDGQQVGEVEADHVGQFNGGIALMSHPDGGHSSFIDPSGRILFGPYEEASPFNREGYAVADGNVINRDGTTIAGGWEKAEWIMHGHFVQSERGDEHALFDIISGEQLMPYGGSRIEPSDRPEPSAFMRTTRTEISRVDAQCHQDGRATYDVHARYFDRSGKLLDEVVTQDTVPLFTLCLRRD